LEKFALKIAIFKGTLARMALVQVARDLAGAFVPSKLRVNTLDLPTPAQDESLGLNV
jgi:hypothetical protein